MFRKLSILFLFAGIITLMAHAFIPHHEHGEIVCFELFYSENNSCEDDEGKDFHSCCLDQQDIIRNSDEDNSLDCDHGIFCEYHFPPILLFLGDFFTLNPEQSEVTNKPYLNLYTSVDIYSTNSLRGPPRS